MSTKKVNTPSPIQTLKDFSKGVNVYLKREDLIHTEYGGNKWRKLKYNISKYVKSDYNCLLTFGGPFSNHIASTAAICDDYDIPSIGLIRGQYKDVNNPTLNKAKAHGMKLYHLSKEEYTLKENASIINDLKDKYGPLLIIPEGGNNYEGMMGMKGMMQELSSYNECDFDTIVVAAGTGTTASGIIEWSNENQHIYVINTLRNQSLTETIKNNLSIDKDNWEVVHDYHFGGFARVNNDLRLFAQSIWDRYGIPLDPVYNSKMMFAIHDMISNDLIHDRHNILLVHTGGHQGIAAYNYLNKDPWIIQ